MLERVIAERWRPRLGQNDLGEPTGGLRASGKGRERRAFARVPAQLMVVLGSLRRSEAMMSVRGRTLDLSAGGCRVVTNRPLSPGLDQAVSIWLPDGDAAVALGRVVDTKMEPSRFEYGIAFLMLALEDRRRLWALTEG